MSVEPAPALPSEPPDLSTQTDASAGLNTAEVTDRRARGLVNDVPSAPSRTIAQIVWANVLTPFNFLMSGLGAVVLIAGSPRDALFLGVVVANILIGVIQEVRAKRTLDRLSVLNAPRARVVRDATVTEVAVGELVLDDVVELRPGDQVVADAVVRTTDGLEIDESLLTGESDPVDKRAGDQVLSGSAVVAGTGRIQVAKVGKDAYAAQLAEEARRFTLVNSELREAVNRIITVVTWLLIPTGILLFISQFRQGDGWREAVVSATAGVVGMVPEGLVLLTSVAFAVGVVRLARRQTLVQELPAIEVLARVDVMCFDKTGTLTEGALDCSGVTAIGGDGTGVDESLAALTHADPDPNATGQALVRRYETGPGWAVAARVPFSSARKWSAVTFDGRGSYVLGAPEMVLRDRFDEVRPAVEEEAAEGRRVLLFAHTDQTVTADALDTAVTPVALVLFEDRVRPDAPETLAYFAAQGVAAKVISGDNPTTVAAVAARAGLVVVGGAVDARQLPTDAAGMADALDRHDVFGRVQPEQKRAMVHALQSQGHTVAMTGDGVNDVLALKDADCGVAMASGSEASRAVAQLVLLDSNFASMPHVVAEGRRVINNIERVASLFLTKTTYALLTSLATGVLSFPYPFKPRHLTLISGLTIGIPAFFLALAPNDERVRKGFLVRVLHTAAPGGTLIAVLTLVAYVIARKTSGLNIDEERTTAVIVAAGVAFLVLVRIARPFTAWRAGLVIAMVTLFVGAFVVPAASDFFLLDVPPAGVLVTALVLVAAAWPLLVAGAWVTDRVRMRFSSHT
jgi:cation-transporting ATPase E